MKQLSHLRISHAAPALTLACALFSGAVALAQPTLDSIYPNGLFQFQPTNKLAFTLSSSGGITPANISVQLSVTNLDTTRSSTLLTTTNGLTVTGTANSRVVTAVLNSNIIYGAVITATDATGVLTTTNNFDTITPSYTWEAEDWDYENGKFIDNPQTNAYAGLVATNNVDAHNPDGGSTAYRPIDATDPTNGNLGNENCGDIPRVQYDPSTGFTDYDIGWMTPGQPVWANYTRTYPAGKWNIFLRAAGNTGGPEAAELYQGGTNGLRLGRFNVPNTANWQVYAWVPMTDIAGNLIEWDTDGTVKTLTVLNNQGNWNGNFFMLMPVNPNYKPKPFISNFSPDASKQMFPTNTSFTFDVNSVPGITATNVAVTVNGVKPQGLTLTGAGHVLHGSFPLAPNVAYKVAIQMTDANGTSTYNADFGTYSPTNYTWEAEDFDYESGKFFDNPQTNAYSGLVGVDGVDAHNTSTGVGTSYRPADPGDLGNEVAGDIKRAQYTTANDYDIGWTAAGNWGNYTRTYPQGKFNVILRAAGNAGGNNVAGLARVTSGVGTGTQTTVPLGQFNVPNTGGWQTYTWAPLVDGSGNLVVVTNSGTVSTFRLNENGGGWNGNFLMLVPVDTIRPVVSELFPNGSAMFTRTNTLSFVASSPLGIEQNAVSVTLNGQAVSGLQFSGPRTNLTVTYPNLQPDTAYRATIVVNTTNNDPYSVSYTFDTFMPTNYTFEAEDYDYENGKFFDNPQIDSYAGKMGIDGVDAHNTSTGVGADYRPEDPGNLGNEVAFDLARAQYVSAGTNDYDVGWTTAGQWGNYTRTYPKGTFYVYMRGSSPSGQTDGASLLRVTSGVGTATQTTSPLGVFNFPATGGWQTYDWVQLVDSAGTPVVVTNSGAVSTFRLNQDNGGWNANFIMLLPVSASAPAGPKLTATLSGDKITIAFPTVSGASYQVQKKDKLTDATWTPLGSAIAGTGSVQSFQETASAPARFYRLVVTGP